MLDRDPRHKTVWLDEWNINIKYPVYLWINYRRSTILGEHLMIMSNQLRIYVLILIGIPISLPGVIWSQAMPVVPEPVIAPSWQTTALDRVRPMGWLKNQMDQSVTGIVNQLDSIPVVLKKLDRFGGDQSPDQNEITDLDAIETSLLWLNGFVDLAILSGNQELKTVVQSALIKQIGYQDQNGYMGIFSAGNRYAARDLDNELYTKALLLSSLLSWYDHSRDVDLLNHIERAIQEAYQHVSFHRQPDLDTELVTLSSGLTMIDVLINMYYKTGQVFYKDFVIDLLQTARQQAGSNMSQFGQSSGLPETLLPSKYGLPRWLASSRSVTSDPFFQSVFQKMLDQIHANTSLVGIPLGIHESEELSEDQLSVSQELLKTYTYLLSLTGNPVYAERIENLFLNGIPSMELPDGTGFSSHSLPNLAVNSNLSYKASILTAESTVSHARRTHILVDYIRSLWFKDNQGFVCASYAPSEFDALWGNRHIRIQETLDFPGDYNLRFNIQTDSACTFMLKIRKPDWARAITINQPYTIVGDFIHVEIEWSGFDELTIVFAPGITSHRTDDGQRWFRFGSLVLAHPIPYQDSVSRTYALEGYRDLSLHAVSNVRYRIKLNDKPKRPHASDPGDLRFSFPALRSDNNEEETIRMVPIRQTTMRQTTFAEYKP